MLKRFTIFLTFSSISAFCIAQPAMQQMADIDKEIALEQKKLLLLQTKATTQQFLGGGNQPQPQIAALYGSAGNMRALLDMGTGGIRDVKTGDVISDNITVASIDGSKGVQLRIGGGKNATYFYLTMKAAPAPTQGQFGTPQSVVQAPGIPMVQPGLNVPPLQPMQGTAIQSR